uniref:MULE transposase domain-containing protein n=1 Tax=Lactuca sativa TaxID=4236 RepID=A0A9R1W9N6_LACSA|nr:hypothetical protein LSAT_V11C200083550 [Lactuca sativa]
MEFQFGSRKQDNDDQNTLKDVSDVNDPKNCVNSDVNAKRRSMGDEVPDVNTHIYQEQYFSSDDEDGTEDFDFPDNDTLNDGGFEIGEISNPNLGKDANHEKDENHLVDEDTEVNIDFTEGQPHDTHDYVSLGGTLYWTPIVSDDIKPKVTSKFDSYDLEESKKRKLGLLHIDIWYAIGKVGPSVRGGLVYDFKNARRNLNCYIGGRDAKFLVNKMNDRKKNVSSFTFEYKVLNKRLNALFWADETAKYNYNSFRDVVSLDATFSMNKYDMVFVPFTSIDNHKKCVTFGAGLLSKEDEVSYEWLLRAFFKAFRKQPQLVISDQDSALKKAIDTVRAGPEDSNPQDGKSVGKCLQGINKTGQLPDNLISDHRTAGDRTTESISLQDTLLILITYTFIQILSIEDAATNQKFRKHFHSIIWNSKLEPHEFENVWHTMLEEFKITDNNWMNTMYGLRRYWIPAFFVTPKILKAKKVKETLDLRGTRRVQGGTRRVGAGSGSRRLLYSLSHPERRTLSPHCDDSCFWPFLSDLEEEEEVGIFEASRSGFGSEVWGTFQSI